LKQDEELKLAQKLNQQQGVNFTISITIIVSATVWSILNKKKKKGDPFPCNLFTNTPVAVIQIFQYR